MGMPLNIALLQAKKLVDLYAIMRLFIIVTAISSTINRATCK